VRIHAIKLSEERTPVSYLPKQSKPVMTFASTWLYWLATICCVALAVVLNSCQRQEVPTSATTPTQTNKLYLAAAKGDLNTMTQLLQNGAVVDAPNEHGDPPLHGATRFGKMEAIVFLLDHGADVNALNRAGETALTWAADLKKLDVMKLLLDRGASVNAGNGLTPLCCAASSGSLEACQLLLAHHADPNGSRSASENTPLQSAAKDGSADIVVALIDAGAKLETPIGPGLTALMLAAENGKWECVRALVQKGANVNVVDSLDANRTPLHFAAAAGNLEIVQFLLSHGALRDAKDKLGNTPYDFAKRAAGSNAELLKALQVVK
jgi:ankyrin repeat protein